MKVLIVSTLFPPDILGGADVAAHHVARWLSRKGHEVSVMATAKNESDAGWRNDDGLNVFRVRMPRAYPAHTAARARKHQKVFWHLQDHFDPANRRIIAEVLDLVRPDVVNLQTLQGIGYNAVAEIAERDIPVVFTLHDLGLACIRMSMFRNERNCERQGFACHLSAAIKWKHLGRLRRLSFWSPSRAIHDRLVRFTPIGRYPFRVIKYPLEFNPPDTPRVDSRRVRLLYVGRIHPTKGVDFLLGVLRRLSGEFQFEISLAGGGSCEEGLRKEFGREPWCRFLGFVPNDRIGEVMHNADLMCAPSLWAENSPLVVYQALGLGLPVLASDAGGLPELIQDGRNGLLIPPGDEAAWSRALSDLLSNPARVRSLRSHAADTRSAFCADLTGAQVLKLFAETIGKEIPA